MIVTLVHRIFTPTGVKPGGGDYLTSYLEDRGLEVVYIENPLSGKHRSRFIKGENISQYNIPFSGVPRWVIEIPFNTWKILSCGKVDLIIAVDPLNFLSAFFAGLIRKVPIQFHAVDYSENRFGIKILDAVYRQVYYFALKNADYVTYVSANLRKVVNSHVSNQSKATLLPNSPEFKKIPKIDPSTKNPLELVYTKSFMSESEIDVLTDFVNKVKREYPNVILNLVGNVSAKSEKKIKSRDLSGNIKVHGLVDYKTNINIVSSSYIGVAWYENLISFEKYADSLKIREYAAAGLPVLCNENITTAIEAQHKGLLFICNDTADLAKNTIKLVSDKQLYRQMRKKALAWAKEYDKTTLLDNFYKFL